MSGYAEDIRMPTLDRSAVFAQRDVKLSRSPVLESLPMQMEEILPKQRRTRK
jgi:hypothetical protein